MFVYDILIGKPYVSKLLASFLHCMAGQQKYIN